MAENEVKYQVRISDEYVEKDMNGASKSLEKSSSKFQGVGKKIGLAVGVSLATVATGAVAIATKATASANDMEKAMDGFIASTGKGVSETKRYQAVLGNIYKNNYGESFEDIAGSMALVNQQMGNLSDEQLQKTTEHAYLLNDTFGIDINESLRSVNSMMKQFGITSEQAYNLLAQGAQNGLNQNGDLADQLSEYSVYYNDMGFSAEETMNIIAAGAKDGAFQIDYLNDAIKEFGIRSKDGSKGTISAFTTLGLDAGNMTKKFAEGGAGAKKAFEEV
ncbi:MAG: phage tail tape measure protein, partial [Clostridia bacterium]